ncbi:hypothetical protein HPB49_018395 [Dermacentor silvarum]|uniref:Uncharacterized protein n=1 Tax=Dermacentor silvarum TaxID=543639 RepID=A0ACB8DQ60_DERSI|nr:hypothetical protein HPB49_018395 [Dermacentor silvarum]
MALTEEASKMADCYGSLADFADFAGRVHDITEDEAYRYAPPLRPRLSTESHGSIQQRGILVAVPLSQASGATAVGNAAAGPKRQRTRSPHAAAAPASDRVAILWRRNLSGCHRGSR